MATTIQTIELPKKARALDTSGNNNHGQIYSGRGLEFDGVSDYLTNTDTTFLGDLSQFTMAAWLYFPVLPTINYGTCFYVGDNGFNHNLPLAQLGTISTNNVISFSINQTNGGSRGVIKVESPELNTNTWYRFVGVYDGASDEILLYINGSLIGTYDTGDQATFNDGHASGKTVDFSNSTKLFIGGGTTHGANVNYHISDAQFWDASWTAADVTYDYLNPESLALNGGGTALTESNLKLWYPMQDGHRGQQSYILDGANSGLGDELITNGDFATDISGWSGSTSRGSYAWDNGRAKITNDAADGYPNLYQNPTTETGKVYKVTATVEIGTASTIEVRIYDGATLGSQQLTTGGEVEFYFTAVGTTPSLHLYLFEAGNTGNYCYFDNVSVKPINDKNHATTVFYGDEMIADAKNRTGFASSDWAAHNIASGNVTVVSSKLQVVTETDSAPEGVKLGPTKFTDLVAGRTYRVSVDLQQTSGATTPTMRIELGSTQTADFNISASSVTYTKDIIATDDDNLIIYNKSNTSSTTFTVDNVSIKEVGVASGWTDADQQLHIPQTALQSYNELAWFDGTIASNGYVDLDSGITTSGNSWSLSFWVFHDDNGQPFEFIAGNGANQIIALSRSGTNFLLYRDRDNVYHAISDAAIPESEWVHITITAIADTSITAYVNGVAQTTNIDMGDTTLLLKRFMRGFASNLYHVFGTINEISYYSDVLTATEVLDLFNDGKAKSALEASGSAGLVGYWRNNGLTEWKDLKGSNDGNVTAGVTETILIPQGVDSTRDNQGFIMNRQKDTSSLNLPRSPEDAYNGSYVNIPSFDFHATTMSVSFWMKARSVGSNETILDKYVTTDNKRALRLYIRSGAELLLQLSSTGSNNEAQETTDANLAIDTWHHIAITYSSGTWLVYKDTNAVSLDAAAFETTTSIEQNTTALLVGGSQGGKDQFDGVIDNLLIYNDVLTSAEVERNYNATKGSHRN